MPTLRSHTHLQAAQANAQTKACKRVCLPNRTDITILDRRATTVKEGRTHNNQSFVGSERPTMKLLLNGSFGSSFQELWVYRKVFRRYLKENWWFSFFWVVVFGGFLLFLGVFLHVGT